MKSVSICLPDIYITGFDRLVQANVIPTRAEGMRNAVMDFLHTLETDWELFARYLLMEDK